MVNTQAIMERLHKKQSTPKPIASPAEIPAYVADPKPTVISKSKMKKWLPPQGWRWPNGTIITKRWDGVAWQCGVAVPGREPIMAFGKSAWLTEKEITKKYLTLLDQEKKQA